MNSLNMDLFVKKVDMILFLQSMYHYSYQEIAYVLNDHPKVIETYCKQIIGSKQRMVQLNKLRW